MVSLACQEPWGGLSSAWTRPASGARSRCLRPRPPASARLQPLLASRAGWRHTGHASLVPQVLAPLLASSRSTSLLSRLSCASSLAAVALPLAGAAAAGAAEAVAVVAVARAMAVLRPVPRLQPMVAVAVETGAVVMVAEAVAVAVARRPVAAWLHTVHALQAATRPLPGTLVQLPPHFLGILIPLVLLYISSLYLCSIDLHPPWALSHRAHNALMHALHGNGSPAVALPPGLCAESRPEHLVLHLSPQPTAVAPLPRPPGLPSHQERTRRRLAAWRHIGAPSHVMRWLREGVRTDWIDGPPPPFHHGVSRFTPEERDWVTSERDRCLQTGAWVRASCFDYVSRAFIVVHNGKRRLVLNFAHVNDFERKRSCRFESLGSLRRMARRDDWMFSCDIADAYHHVGMFPGDQRYFTFALETDSGVEYFSASALSFGWTRSPWYFTQVMKPVVAYLRTQASRGSATAYGQRAVSQRRAHPLRILPWLDDFAFFVQGSRAEATGARDFAFDTLAWLGILRNVRKGQAEPSHFLEDHLGYGIDTARGLFLLTARREAKLRLGASALLRRASSHRRLVRARELASFAGLAQSSALAVPLARCWLRSLYDDLSAQGGWSGCVRLSRQTLIDLRLWCSLRHSRHVGRSIWLRPDHVSGSIDAGPLGWGGQLGESTADVSRVALPAHGFWSAAEAALHITWRELRAVRLFVEWYVHRLRGRRLLLFEDNQAVVAILTTLTTRSPLLMRELRLLLEVLDFDDISLRAVYIRSAENRVADYYSRLARPRDYTVLRAHLDEVQRWWGQCTVDAFASAATAQVQRFWSAEPSGTAEATDAFAQCWLGERVWAHPPPFLLAQVAQLLRAAPSLEALVCAPCWQGESWYAELLELSSEHVTYAAGALHRVSFDAPARLESWPVTVFRVLPRAS